MDNTSKQFDNDIVKDNEEGVLHKNINYEVGILQKHSNTEMEEVTLESTCKQVDESKQSQTPVTSEMNEGEKIHPALLTMSSQKMKEVLKKIIKRHQDESMTTSQKQSTGTSQQLQEDDVAVDKPTSQVSQELNVSCEKDESKTDASVQITEKLSNTRETLLKMNKEEMKERLTKIVQQHQKDKQNTVQNQSSKSLETLNCSSSVVGQCTTQPLTPIQQLIKDRINNWMEDTGLYKPTVQSIQQQNGSERQTIESSRILNVSEDKPALQANPELNASDHKDEIKSKEVVTKKGCRKKRLRNTRGTMYQMNNESMTELRMIIKQHQEEDSITLPAQKESIDSSQQLNDKGAVDIPQESQELNVSWQKDEMNKSKEVLNNRNCSTDHHVHEIDQVQVKKRSVKKRGRNTRGTMYNVSNENMMELRNIIRQNQKDDLNKLHRQSTGFVDNPQVCQQLDNQKTENEYSISLSRKKYVETGSIKELNVGRKVPFKTKPRKNGSIPQTTIFRAFREKLATISLNELRQKELPLQSKYGVETGFIKQLRNGQKMLIQTTSNDNKDIQTVINLKLTPYDECWTHSKIHQNVSKIPSLSTIKEINEECWPQSMGIKVKVLHLYKLTLPTIVEETEHMQQIIPPLGNFSKEDTVSISNKVSVQQPASIREYLALPETYNNDLQFSEKIKKIFMTKTQWSKRVEKKKRKSELHMFLELTKQQMDAVVSESESNEIWIETQVNLKQNETDEFKHEIHKMVSRLEIKLEENQQPLYLLRKEYEKLTSKLASTKNWKIKRKRKLQQEIMVISQNLRKVNDTNNSIMDKIAEYDFHYVNKTS